MKSSMRTSACAMPDVRALGARPRPGSDRPRLARGAGRRRLATCGTARVPRGALRRDRRCCASRRRVGDFATPGLLDARTADLIVTRAWWDHVDEFGARAVGRAVRRVPAPRSGRRSRGWQRVADDRWLRRASIICQLGRARAHRRATCSPTAIAASAASRRRLPAQGDRLGAARLRAHRPGLGARASSHAHDAEPARRVREALKHALTPSASGAQLRAPCRLARAAATAASRAAVASSTVSVRSGARKRSAKASDRMPGAEPLGVGVDVEQPHRLEQRPGRRRAACCSTSAAGTSGADDQRDVEQHRRVAEIAGARGRRRHRQRVEVELHRAGALGQAERGDDPRVQLAGVADRPRRRAAARRTGRGATARASAARDGRARRGRRGRRPARPRRRRPSRPARPGPHQPVGSTSPHSTAARWRGWPGSAASSAASSVVGRPARRRRASAPARRAVARARNTSPVSKSARSRVPRPRLRSSGGEQAGQQRGAQLRLVLGQRVDQPQRARRGSSAGRPSASCTAGATNGNDEHLDVARPRPARATTARLQLLPAGQAARRPGRPAARTAACRSRRAARPPRPGRPAISRSGRQVGGCDLQQHVAGRRRCSRPPPGGPRPSSRGDRHAGHALRAGRPASAMRAAARGVPTTV